MLVKRHSGFLALGFLIGVDDLEDIVLTLVNPSGVKTMVASRIYLNFSDRHTYQLVCIIFDVFKIFMFIYSIVA